MLKKKSTVNTTTHYYCLINFTSLHMDVLTFGILPVLKPSGLAQCFNYAWLRVLNTKVRALEGNRTPVRGSTIPYTNHCTTKATETMTFFHLIN